MFNKSSFSYAESECKINIVIHIVASTQNYKAKDFQSQLFRKSWFKYKMVFIRTKFIEVFPNIYLVWNPIVLVITTLKFIIDLFNVFLRFNVQF